MKLYMTFVARFGHAGPNIENSNMQMICWVNDTISNVIKRICPVLPQSIIHGKPCSLSWDHSLREECGPDLVQEGLTDWQNLLFQRTQVLQVQAPADPWFNSWDLMIKECFTNIKLCYYVSSSCWAMCGFVRACRVSACVCVCVPWAALQRPDSKTNTAGGQQLKMGQERHHKKKESERNVK